MENTNELSFYSVQEIADILKVSKRTVFRYMHAGTLHAVKIGKAYRISQESLEAFLQGKPQT